MYYTELEYINLLVNGVDIGDDYAITNHDLSDFFNGKREDVPKEYKYIERELLSIRDIFNITVKLCRHSYYCYLVAILTSIYNEGLKVPDEFFKYLKNHRCYFPTIDHLSNLLIMIYLPHRMDYILMERDNRIISLARLYHRIGWNAYFMNRANIYNEHEKDFFDLIKDYECVGSNYIRSLFMGFYYTNYQKYNLSLESLKYRLDNIDDIADKMKINNMNYENMDEEMILNCFQERTNKIIIR